MLGLSTWEILIILALALIFIGPDQLPRVARKLGEGVRQVKGAMSRVDAEVRTAIREATAEDALAEEEEERRKTASLVPQRPTPTHEHDPATPPAPMTPLPHNAPVLASAAEPVFEAQSGGGVTVGLAPPAGTPASTSERRAPAHAVPRPPRIVVATPSTAGPAVEPTSEPQSEKDRPDGSPSA